MLYLQHVCDRLKSCLKKKPPQGRNKSETKQIRSLKNINDTEDPIGKPLCGWSGNPAGAVTAIFQNFIFLEYNTRFTIIFFVIQIKKQRKIQRCPPENSSKTRKGSKYLSSNLNIYTHKTNQFKKLNF